MNKIFVTILMVFALCVSCRGKSSVSATENNEQDSIIALRAESPFDFLEELGIDYKSLISKDDSLPSPSGKDLLLTTKKQRALLNGVIGADFESSEASKIYLVSVRKIHEDVALCQYKYLNGRVEDVYIATYDSDGTLKDAMYLGNTRRILNHKTKLSDSTELISRESVLIYFIGDNEFTDTREYKETEHNIYSGKDTTTYVQTVSMVSNIGQNGRIVITTPVLTDPKISVYEEGLFRRDPNDKKGWNLMRKIRILTSFPYSDESVLEVWDSLGNEVDGYVAESFEGDFFNYVFRTNPQKVLRYIYENRDNESLSLTMPLRFNYTNFSETRKVIDTAISKVDNLEMVKYFNDMTQLWISDATD